MRPWNLLGIAPVSSPFPPIALQIWPGRMLAGVGLPQSPHRESGRPVDRPLDLLADLHKSAALLNQTPRETEGPEVLIGVKHPLTDAKGWGAVGVASYDFLAAGVGSASCLAGIVVVGLGRSIVAQSCLNWSVDILRGFGGYNGSGVGVGLGQYRWS